MLGDKELGFVLPQTEFAAAAAVARSICARIGESASAVPGLAEWHPQMSLDDLMDAARRTLPTACAKAS
jgi:PleD family two-component response regulator